MEGLLSLAVKAVFVENLALSFFLGHVYVHRGFQEDLDRFGIGYFGHGRAGHHCADQQPVADLPAQAGCIGLGRVPRC